MHVCGLCVFFVGLCPCLWSVCVFCRFGCMFVVSVCVFVGLCACL